MRPHAASVFQGWAVGEGKMSEVTRILAAVEQGDGRAVDQLLPAVYEELRRLAAWKLSREKPGQTLQATALVHEAYLRLVGEARDWKSRTRFFTAAAEAMRRILIENARRKKSQKYGGGHQRTDLTEGLIVAEEGLPPEDLLALDEALDRLARKDPLKAELVKLRFFGGLTAAEAAEVLGLSHNTADEYWAYARAWLRLEVFGGSGQVR
jgi:RNA polymerase sigma factor (TIGR02999 family)